MVWHLLFAKLAITRIGTFGGFGRATSYLLGTGGRGGGGGGAGIHL